MFLSFDDTADSLREARLAHDAVYASPEEGGLARRLGRDQANSEKSSCVGDAVMPELGICKSFANPEPLGVSPSNLKRTRPDPMER